MKSYKRLVWIVILGIYLVSCETKSTEITSNDLDKLEVVKSLYSSLSVNNPIIDNDIFDDNILWIEPEGFPPYPEKSIYHGKKEIYEFVFLGFEKHLDFISIEPDTLIESTNSVFVLGNLKYKLKKAEDSLNVQALQIWDFENNKIVKFQLFTNTKKVHDYFEKTKIE